MDGLWGPEELTNAPLILVFAAKILQQLTQQSWSGLTLA